MIFDKQMILKQILNHLITLKRNEHFGFFMYIQS